MGLVLAVCGGPEPAPVQVRRTLEAARQAVVERDLAALRDTIAEGYADPTGRTKRDIEDLLRFWVLRSQKLYAWTFVSEVRVPVGATRANATVYAALASQPIESAQDLRRSGVSADLYRLELTLDEAGDAWQVVSAEWKRASLADLPDVL